MRWPGSAVPKEAKALRARYGIETKRCSGLTADRATASASS